MNTSQDEGDRLTRKRKFYETRQRLERSYEEADQAYEISRKLLSDGIQKKKSRSPTSAKQVTSAASKPQNVEPSQQAKRVPAFSGPPPSAVPKSKSKGKAADVIKLVPAQHRLFAGLQFFFFPNNDANPARRMRIIKAIEYGASWQKDWNSYVTHIIVDKDMTYTTLLTHLKIEAIPPSAVVVNETWPADCLAHRTLMNPDRSIYAVEGAPATVAPTVPATALPQPASSDATPSDTSLVLKPAGKAVQAKPPSTQRSSPAELPRNRGVLENDGLIATQDDSSSELPLEFQQVISQARDLASMPLDEQDDDNRTSSPTTSQASTVSPVDAKPRKLLTHQDRFQCMQVHTADRDPGPNGEILRILQQMADYHQQTGDEWRTRAYRKAVATIRNHKEKILTKEQAQALPNIGERLAEKIEEIAFTHRLRRLDAAHAEPADQTLSLFMKIYAVGYAQASKWVRQGYRSIEDLLKNEKLTFTQRIGVEHFEDFNLRIPRVEVKQHADIVLQALRQIDRSFSLIVGGSYRRGSPDSGDIDCVITHPTYTTDQMRVLMIDQIIAPLTKQGFLKAELSAFSREEGSKWHGASCLPDSTVWRRLDFLLVQDNELGAAMIYFTGNDIFNRSMRLLASKKGMRLNQRGLYQDVMRGKGSVKLTDGRLIEGKDERKIFEILGVPWREPWERLV